MWCSLFLKGCSPCVREPRLRSGCSGLVCDPRRARLAALHPDVRATVRMFRAGPEMLTRDCPNMPRGGSWRPCATPFQKRRGARRFVPGVLPRRFRIPSYPSCAPAQLEGFHATPHSGAAGAATLFQTHPRPRAPPPSTQCLRLSSQTGGHIVAEAGSQRSSPPTVPSTWPGMSGVDVLGSAATPAGRSEPCAEGAERPGKADRPAPAGGSAQVQP